MTAHDEAQLLLAKRREFLGAAENSRDLGLANAAASDAVISAINSKDAICLALTGRTEKSDNHPQAVAELKRAGPVGAELATHLRSNQSWASRAAPASVAGSSNGCPAPGTISSSLTP